MAHSSSSSSSSALRNTLEAIFNGGTLIGLTDRQLLERFLDGPSAEADSAFRLLVERHGPMVLRVCRGILHNRHDAEDAFQATFLTLVNQGALIRKADSLGSWLHGVALRVSACQRSSAARRRTIERRGRLEPTIDAGQDADRQETHRLLHDEIERLPDRFRAPIILCDLQAHPLDAAARQLGWPLGTVKSRLSRGRQRLRDRLIRRGLAPATAGTLLMGGLDATHAALPIEIIERTASLATAIRHGAGAGAAATAAVQLAQTAGRAVALAKFKIAALGLASLGLLTATTALMMMTGRAAQAPPASRPPVAAVTVVTNPAQPVPPSSPMIAPAAIDQIRTTKQGGREVLVTIQGKAVDESGKPVPGATIHAGVANPRRSTEDKPVTTQTDADGNYTIRDMPLALMPAEQSPIPTPEQGKLQIFGTADGFGFTWEPVVIHRPVPRGTDAARDKADAAAHIDRSRVFYQNEPIRCDLTFSPPATLRGRIQDTEGHPLANARVQVGYSDSTMPGRIGERECYRMDLNRPRLSDQDEQFNGIAWIPASMRSTVTGPDGLYQIKGLPRETLLLVTIDPGPLYGVHRATIVTSSNPKFEKLGTVGHDGVFNQTFESPIAVRLRVKHEDGRPARGATVRAQCHHTMLRDGAVATTDASGLATLHLRPGPYSCVIEPAPDALELPANVTVQVEKAREATLRDVVLPRAARVILKTVNTAGEGLKGIGFEYLTGPSREHKDVQSRPGLVDHPLTDSNGELRAVLPPGRYRFYLGRQVGIYLKPWKGLVPERIPDTGEVELEAGAERVVSLTLEKDEQAATNADDLAGLASNEILGPLAEKWKRDRRLMRTGKFQVRHFFASAHDADRAKLEAFLESNDLSHEDDLTALVGRLIPGVSPGREDFLEEIEDGDRWRTTNLLADWLDQPDVRISNGREGILYYRSDATVRLFGRVYQSMWPFPTRYLGYQIPRKDPRDSSDLVGEVHQEQSRDGKRSVISFETKSIRHRIEVDPATGFVFVGGMQDKTVVADASHRPYAEQTLYQYGPNVLKNGAVSPTVTVSVMGHRGKVETIALTRMVAADPSYQPRAEDFVLSVPAGTTIMDDRNRGNTPFTGVCQYPVPDVVSYADQWQSPDRLHNPATWNGQPAPRLQAVAWLDRNGPIEKPSLDGKVVLIDFWGLSHGPSLSQMPELRTIAAYLADRPDFVLIGLHRSGASLEDVKKFASQQQLTFPLAIDAADADEDWFGASFKDYAVRSIPSAAVIDREGKVAYIGPFEGAMNTVNDLLGKR